MTKSQFKWARLALALTHTVTGIIDMSVTGWKPFIWYYADWQLVLTLVTQWCLVIVHFFPFNAKLNSFVHHMFQIVFPMEVAITLIYWTFFISRMQQSSQYAAYIHPIFQYILPCLMLITEWVLNAIIFQYNKIVYVLVVYLLYVPLTYIGQFVLGYYPYPFITWNDLSSFGVLLALGIL